MESSVSYLSMKKEQEIQMNSITPDNLVLNQVIPTIKRMYLNGANDMDSKWREAIMIYADEHDIPFTRMMLDMLGILNR